MDSTQPPAYIEEPLSPSPPSPPTKRDYEQEWSDCEVQKERHTKEMAEYAIRKKRDDEITGKKAGSLVRTKPILTHLALRAPSHAHSTTPTRIFLSATVLVEAQDVFLLSSTTTYQQVLDSLKARARAKEVIGEAKAGETVYAVLSMVLGKWRTVALDAGNWEAGREMLFETEGASLRFGLAVVGMEVLEVAKGKGEAVAAGEQGKKRKGRCVVQ